MKLKDLLNENCLGKLPSESMFKLNKETGKYESPKQRGIKEDYSTMQLKSNIAVKWRDVKDITSDIQQFIESIRSANGDKSAEAIKKAIMKGLK